MAEVKEGQVVKQPWECMGDAFKQINNLFKVEKKEQKKSEAKHERNIVQR